MDIGAQDHKALIAELFEQNEKLIRKNTELMRKDTEHTKKIMELQKSLDERPTESKKEAKDGACQTELYMMGIDKLVKASIALKKIKEKQLQEHQNHLDKVNQHPQHSQVNHQTSTKQTVPVSQHIQRQQSHPLPQKSQQNGQAPRQVMTQLHYPNVTLPKQQTIQPTATTQLYPDEKEILENVFKLDGYMTTILHKLKANLDTH